MPFYAHTPPQNSTKWHPLKCHLFKVAKLARKFGNKFNAGELAYYAGLWHDLGKYNPEFQEYLEQCDRGCAASPSDSAYPKGNRATKLGEKPPRQKVIHAVYGAILAAEQFEPLAAIIYGHHSGIPALATLCSKKLKVPKYQQLNKRS